MQFEIQALILLDVVLQYVQGDADAMAAVEYVLGRPRQRAAPGGEAHVLDDVAVVDVDAVVPFAGGVAGAYELHDP